MRKSALPTVGFFVACQLLLSQDSGADSRERMRQLHDLTNWADNQGQGSQQDRNPIWGGPDDDPTTAMDVPHEAPAAARKCALRAERLAKKQEHDQAIAEYQRALQIDPQYYEAENNLALEYFNAGKADTALNTLKRLTKTEPNRVLAFDNAAIILCRAGRYPEAEVFATQAYHLHPFSYKAAYVFGSALANQGKRTPEAKQALKYASEKHPEAKELLAKWPRS